MTPEEEIDTLLAQLRLFEAAIPCRCDCCQKIYVKSGADEAQVYLRRLRWNLETAMQNRFNEPADANHHTI